MIKPYNGWTPESVNQYRGFGQGLMNQGVDSSPVGHWTQALARVLGAGTGAAWTQQANEADRAGKQGVADIYRQGLQSGMPMNKLAAALMDNPWGAERGQQMADRYMLKTAESSGPLAAAKLDQIKAHSDLQRAQAQFYRQRGAALNRPEPAAPAAAPAADPLAGAGIDDNGSLVVPGQGAAGSQWPGANEAGASVFGRKEPPGMMRLGGPVDDIDRSMMPDEGRGRSFASPTALGIPRGVQVAQATGRGADARNPQYIPYPGENWGVGAGYGGPSIVDQARERTFGKLGVTTLDVPGIVTTPRGSPSQMATREYQGQRAFESATPEQQQRLLRLRQEQAFWTSAYGRQPRAGYYYGPDGREMPLTDKNFKGDRETQAVALMNLKKIDEASKTLLNAPLGFPQRAFQGFINQGEVGQAFNDMKQGAMGIAYALSGKTVAVAEMKNFMDAYGPSPFDSADRIVAKTKRLRQFYEALMSASRGGESYEQAFARAMATMGVKNPDGTATGAPAAASAGAQSAPPGAAAPDVKGLSTDELMRRAFGGR